jgi:hypothetical protein
MARPVPQAPFGNQGDLALGASGMPAFTSSLLRKPPNSDVGLLLVTGHVLQRA